MVITEPGRLEVLVNGWLMSAVGRFWYWGFINSMGLRGDERIIDYGSGTGIGAWCAAQVLKNGHVTCVDVSKAWLDAARRRLGGFDNVDFRLGDICTLGLPGGAYDGIIVSFVLHDIDREDRPTKVKCLADRLKAGGKIFLKEPLGANHGMPAREVDVLMRGAGMAAERSAEVYMPTMGRCIEATYVKK
jgi:ubiquinone/menaquinone biosynthesis C-methylase UbiE